MTRIEELESLDLQTLPASQEGLQQFSGAIVRELISSYRRIDYLQNQLYGRKSERYIDPNQLTVPLEFPAQSELTPAQGIPEKEVITYERKKRRGRNFKDLPIIEEHRFPEKEELCCSHCGEQKREEKTEETSQLHYEPCKICNKKTIKHIFKCKNGCEAGLTSPQPEPHIIDKCLATPELIAHVIVSKFVDHLPLHRIGKIFNRHGVEIPDTTLIGWVNQFGAALLVIVSYIAQRILESKLIGSDDTKVKVLNCSSNKNPKTDWNGSIIGRFWQYQSLEGWIYFDYTPDRSAKGPTEFLHGFKNYLQADDYAGYNNVYRQGAIQIGCFAHARRNFFELPNKHQHRDEVLRLIGGLYQVERQIKTAKNDALEKNKSFADEHVVAIRQEKALPVFNNLISWLKEKHRIALPKSDFAQAANYVLSNQDALCRYLSVGFIPIDNTWVERTHRFVAIGRKNWLFCGNNETAQNAARIITLMTNCVSAQVNPYDYLVYLMKNYSSTSIKQVRTLTPWGYKEFLASKKTPAPP